MALAPQSMPTAQMDAINRQLDTLRAFNSKVDRLEQTRFWHRYENLTPNVIMKMEDVTFEKTGTASMAIIGRIDAWLEEFDQDEVDAFVLTFRMFTQDNDRISLRRLSEIYASPWMSGGNAQECFEDARSTLNDRLDSAATLMFGNDQISVRQICDIVIYGGLAHTNEEKSTIFENWKQSGIMGFIWAEFFAYARHAVETLQYLRGLNQGVLDHIEKHGFVFDSKDAESS
jgi:hypothetical protein